MRKAAMLVLFALLAVAIVFAQTPGSTNSNSTTSPQTQNTNPNNPTTPNPDQNATTPGSATGNQNITTTTTDQNANQNNNTQAQPNMNQTTVPDNTQTANPSGNQTNVDNSGLGNRPNISAGPGDVSAGTEIRATLDTPLSTKTSKPGDRFTATINQPVQGNSGSVVIPSGSRVEGEVGESEEAKTLPP